MKNILIKLNSWKSLILTVFIVGLAAVITGGVFYWKEVRPTKIFSACHRAATKVAQEEYSNSKENTKYRIDDYELNYKRCLRSRGINK